MGSTVYITAMEPQSGKSVVALGMMEMLSGRVERLGFFRPIVPAGPEPDAEIELIRRRYELDASYDEMHALTEDEAAALIANGARQEVEKRVVEAYRALEQRCDFVLCEGTDFTGSAPGLDFDLNTDLANQLGAPVLVAVRGRSADTAVDSVRLARESLAQKGCTVFGVIVNRVPPELFDRVSGGVIAIVGDEPVYMLPEVPELARPTMREIAAALGGEILVDAGGTLDREVGDVRIAAMSVEHFIDDLEPGTLVIVPGDRPDILVASLASAVSPAVPPVAGVVVTAGYPMSETVRRLIETAPFPVLEVPHRTYVAATAVQSVRPMMTADSERKIAAALGVFDSHVDVAELERRIMVKRPRRMTPLMFEYELIDRAKAERQHIVLPEGEDDRVLRAAEILLRRGVAHLTILGPADEVRVRAGMLGLDLGGAEVVDPLTSPLRADYANRYYEVRKHRGVTEEGAFDVMADVTYFGAMMVQAGAVDGMVSGAAHTTADTIRPAFEFIRARPGVSVISSVFFMCLADRVLVFGDCAVNPRPDTEQLADIAMGSAETAAAFGVEPRVAMLSYSTGESGRGPDVTAVRMATELVRERRPDLKVEGPIQYDAAVDASVANLKLPGSEVAGRATVFIFPDLDTGNVAYKAVQRSADALAIGPVLQGLNKPVNDLSRGCTIPDIVNTVAITAVQAVDAKMTPELRASSRVLRQLSPA